MFKLQTPRNTRRAEKPTKATGLVTTTGALYFNSITTGALQLAGVATTTNQQLYRANETIAAADLRTDVHCTLVDIGDRYLVDVDNNSNAAHNGQRMILNASGLTLTNTGTDVPGTTGVFVQVSPVGAAAAKQIIAERVS